MGALEKLKNTVLGEYCNFNDHAGSPEPRWFSLDSSGSWHHSGNGLTTSASVVEGFHSPCPCHRVYMAHRRLAKPGEAQQSGR